MKTSIKNYLTMALFVVLSLVTTIARAHNGENNPPAAQLKYLGILKNQPVFQLDLSSVNEQQFTISIKDQFGESLYTERVKAKAYTKKFLLDLDNLGDAVLRVEVKSGRNKPEVFKINRNTKYYEETSISKL